MQIRNFDILRTIIWSQLITAVAELVTLGWGHGPTLISKNYANARMEYNT